MKKKDLQKIYTTPEYLFSLSELKEMIISKNIPLKDYEQLYFYNITNKEDLREKNSKNTFNKKTKINNTLKQFILLNYNSEIEFSELINQIEKIFKAIQDNKKLLSKRDLIYIKNTGIQELEEIFNKINKNKNLEELPLYKLLKKE